MGHESDMVRRIVVVQAICDNANDYIVDTPSEKANRARQAFNYVLNILTCLEGGIPTFRSRTAKESCGSRKGFNTRLDA